MGGEELHPDFDPERWVVVENIPDRLYLGYNPHISAPYRIGVWSPAWGASTRISASEVIDASPSARAWLDGYLTGSEPDLADMFGPDSYDFAKSNPRFERWRTALRRYRETGRWTGGYWVELTPITGELLAPAWTEVADEVWTWDGTEWSMAGLAPEATITPTGDTRCDERSAHSMAVIDERHLQCEDCGNITETEPD
jgi:hypothetical protein